uniref:Uncharacterized protein n=1 Tax=Arundo donax TaxID=35708 RepID=A0A0A9BAM6_ARUDO
MQDYVGLRTTWISIWQIIPHMKNNMRGPPLQVSSNLLHPNHIIFIRASYFEFALV